MIYPPSEDSYLIQKYVKKYAKGKVLDMGTGSGILALEALKKTKNVLAADINKEVIINAKKLGIKVVQSNLFSKIKRKFDLIIFNPPYLPEHKNEPKDSKLATTGGKKGYELIKKFLKQVSFHLNKDGRILILISSLTGNPKTIFRGYNFKLLETQNLFFESISIYILQKVYK